jgi:heme/copper-type cytochrome/quinol oxidase subunit 3
MELTKVSNNKTTNFRNWSFRFLIYLFLLNVLVAYIIATTTTLTIELEGYEKPTNNSDIILSILVILTNILLISGIILTALSVVKKEKKDYKYIISIIGYSIFLIIGILSLF